jgi:pullulanase-type alpha-1,6-glucosidase
VRPHPLRRLGLPLILLLLLSIAGLPGAAPRALAAVDPIDADLVTPSLRHPIRDSVFYFVLPDRFHNGSLANDTGGIGGGPTSHGFLPSEKGYYHGGDLAGLRAKLPYLQELGVGAIWMTPIFKNKPLQDDSSSLNGVSAGYHGYWITDFTSVDPHFGTNQELADLIADAQGRGMKVFFDIITNHTADVIRYEGTETAYRSKAEFPYKDASGNAFDDVQYASGNTFPPLDAATSFPYKPFPLAGEENIKSPSWLNDPIYYHNRGDTTYSGENSTYGDFIKSLDDLFTEHPVVVNGMTEIYQTWIDDFGIDGFRIDTVKHVNIEFWQRFGPAIMDYARNNGKPEFFMFGEVFDGDPAFKSVYTTKGALPATLDFGFQGNARGFASQSKPTNELRDFFAKDDYYTDADSNVYSTPTFLGNHDMGRVGLFLKQDNAGATDAELVARSKLAHALMFTARGMPVIYYGDEQGFVGDGGDKDARQDMMPSQVASYNDDDLIGTNATTAADNFDTTHPLYTALKQFAQIRAAHPALRQGAQIDRKSSPFAGIYAFSRIDRAERVEYVVALNNAEAAVSESVQTFSPGMNFTAVYPLGAPALTSDANGSLALDVPALDFVIYKAAEPLAANTTTPVVTLDKPAAGALVRGRLEVAASLDSARFAEVTFAVKIGNATTYTVIGTDDNAPYRVFYDVSALPAGTPLEFKAIANDLSDDAGSNVGALDSAEVSVTRGEDRGNNPDYVTIAGSLQSELGCAGDWDPACENTFLDWDRDDDVWQKSFTLDAGSYEYKAAINRSWDENYGANAALNGANIALNHAGGTVKFYYDHKTHWVTSNKNAVIAVAPGSFQSELGCPGDWQPDCLRSWLQDPDGDGKYSFTTDQLPAGSYEVKVAINESWDENYGQDGAPNGPNIAFSVPTNGTRMKFEYDAVTHLLTIGEDRGNNPDYVTIPGSFQSELGCPGDWQPDCANTFLTYDRDDDVWQKSFTIPAGSWEYKAALNRSWDENYGAGAQRNGPNIPLNLADQGDVKFYYDRKTNWVTSNKNSLIATAPGSFQSELGCPGDWQPDCLRSWLQDPDGDGTYTFTTTSLPAGNYEVKVAINESWSENYGQGGVRDGANIPFTVARNGEAITFSFDATSKVLTVAEGETRGNIRQAAAHWVARDTIAWNVTGGAANTYRLHTMAGGGLTLTPQGVTGGETIALTFEQGGLSAALKAKFPHLSSYAALKIGAADLDKIPAALKGQLAVDALDASGKVVDAAALQIPGVLDDLYAYSGPLGVTWNGSTPTLRLWAPTATSVKLHVFSSSTATGSTVYPMTPDAGTWVWSVSGNGSWRNKYYLYEVEVFVPSTGKVEKNLVTDPYSLSLSTNSRRSQLVNMSDAALKPAGWDNQRIPPLAAPEDIVLYELHVRDFSANDRSVPAAMRGTFGAFQLNGANGMSHLRRLARAGLTHVHLLPAFDCASINEDKSTWQSPDPALLATFGPNSLEQGTRVEATKDLDGFNWCYDPFHYTVPEGAYAQNPDGLSRVWEFRAMVRGLHQNGLRVVMDVVYNHTAQSGQGEKSVLDKIVPGYYHRLNPATGEVERSTCCENTATEHAMMRKLMIDSVLVWARDYKVTGFRFDLMGHHMKADMLALRAALDGLTEARDGVDGKSIYIYGEGWNFGEVADNARGVNATQLNMAGTGIGTFSDRLRDAVRGGGPFDGGQDKKKQGFINGLWYDPNALPQGTEAEQKARLLLYQDQIKVGLAGNLADYELVDRTGATVKGSQVDYNGQPAGYTSDPQEVVTYIEAHDNETLFDKIQYAAPAAATVKDRVRMQNLGISVVMLAQGVPFFQAGQDLLRSKSFDRNSYNSGDWFNRLDWTYQSNNWGVGIPPNESRADATTVAIMSELLGNPALKPQPSDIVDAATHFQEMLRIRKSSPLFRLQTAEQVKRRVFFLNNGPDQTPGLIVMCIDDVLGPDLDPGIKGVCAFFNATDERVTYRDQRLVGLQLRLHPVQLASADALVRTSSYNVLAGAVTVPARTTAVFVLR